MKELKSHKENPLVQEIQIPVKTELKKIGMLTPHKGHTVYEFNYVTKELSPALFEKQDAILNPETMEVTGKRTILTNPKSIYFSALNIKNAEKKIRKNLREH